MSFASEVVMQVQTEQRIREVFGSRGGGDVLAEFAKVDSQGGGGGVGTVASTHSFLGGPPTGATPGASTFRALVTSDMPGALTPTSLAVSGQSGFYGHVLVAQPTSGHVIVATAAGTGAAVLADSTFTGGSGASAYTIGDIVLALKQLGLIAL